MAQHNDAKASEPAVAVPLNLALFGASGALGQALAAQALAAGHSVRALARTPSKLSAFALHANFAVVEGDATAAADVAATLEGCDAVLFALGCDANSPEGMCTTATQHILARVGKRRFVWCGGGSTKVEGDPAGIGPWFVSWWAKTLMRKKHEDKDAQLALLHTTEGLASEWIGVRPLQMGQLGVRTATSHE